MRVEVRDGGVAMDGVRVERLDALAKDEHVSRRRYAAALRCSEPRLSRDAL